MGRKTGQDRMAAKKARRAAKREAELDSRAAEAAKLGLTAGQLHMRELRVGAAEFTAAQQLGEKVVKYISGTSTSKRAG